MSSLQPCAGQPHEQTRAPGVSIFDDGTPTPAELEVVDWLLTTTRSNRKTLDLTRPVPMDVITDCIELAAQAPSAHNEHRLHWVIVTSREKREAIAEVYRAVWQQLNKGERRKVRRWRQADQAQDKVQDSADWLPHHLHEVPVLVIPCMVGPRDDERIEREWARGMKEQPLLSELTTNSARLWLDTAYFGSAYPSVWSFQLALRSRGLGSVLTVMHLAAEEIVARELGLGPTVVQIGLLPVAYTTKRTFKAASRPPLSSRLHIDGWR